MATRDEVARLAGVSGATVSRVFNNHPVVTDRTRKQVLEAARKLNYYPNSNGRRLVSSRTNTLVVMMPYVSDKVHIFYRHYFAEILSGIAQVTNSRGYDMLVSFYPIGESPAESCVKILMEKKADGALILGSWEDDSLLERLIDVQATFVLIGGVSKEQTISFIDGDHRQGARAVVDYLVGLGHRRICFVNGPWEYSNSRDRQAGYIEGLEAAGIPVEPNLILTGRYSRTSGYQLVEQILSRSPDAIFAANDRMAFGIYQGFRERQISIPEQYSLVGYDDSDLAGYMEPKLTTVSVPLYEMGLQGAEIVINQLEGTQHPPIQRLLPTELVIRGTVGRKE
ncbi:MAG: LacI family transcriptional regulator [Limnochordia bacterium]|nr:LacI family transcriptional regulator [Limnochordia bacterium]